MTTSNLKALATLHITVIGDIIYDRYLRGRADRLSPEAPVPVVAIHTETEHLGGAANVAQNLRAIGCQVSLLGLIGGDAGGSTVQRLCDEQGIERSGVVQGPGPTTEKVRVLAGHHQVVRYDRERVAPLEKAGRQALLTALDGLPKTDAIIVSDYGKGVVDAALIGALLRRQKLLVVDPKPVQPEKYTGAALLTPNRREFELLSTSLGLSGTMAECAAGVIEKLQLSRGILITLGAEGMLWLEKGGAEYAVAAEFRPVFDVTGAGDTVVAVFAALLAAGVASQDAVRIANAAGAQVVGAVGTATVSVEFIASRLA